MRLVFSCNGALVAVSSHPCLFVNARLNSIRNVWNISSNSCSLTQRHIAPHPTQQVKYSDDTAVYSLFLWLNFLGLPDFLSSIVWEPRHCLCRRCEQAIRRCKRNRTDLSGTLTRTFANINQFNICAKLTAITKSCRNTSLICMPRTQ